MKEAVFLTGGTGFLGTEIAAALLRNSDGTPSRRKIYVLTRAENAEAARHRLRAVWQGSEPLRRQIGTQILPVAGDLTKPDLGLGAEDRALLLRDVGWVIHAGAEVGFQKGERELMRVNRDGTANLLAFAETIPGLARFIYISTAYVAGQTRGRILEDAPLGGAYSSLYEESKAAAEALVRACGLPFVICRPGMIVGNSKTGWARSFQTVYYLLKLLLTGRLRFLPISKQTGINILPADYVARAVVDIAFSPAAEGRVFHLTCPEARQPRAGELTAHVRAWAKQHLAVNLPRVWFLPLPALKKIGLAYNMRKRENRRKTTATNLLTLLPYFYGSQAFDRSNTDALIGADVPDWHAYIDALLDFACRKNFMRQTGETVFEQAAVRRASRQYPMHFYDVRARSIRKAGGAEVSRIVEQIRNALWAWGVRRGDRVALTGVNSIDYMALDQAIGRLGAVSVPIYYTTPVEEVGPLLDQSGAGWFFIGDPRMLAQIGRLRTNAHLVVFSAALESDTPGILRWPQFLERACTPAPEQHPEPEDLATIRYTSGTTGAPKGVMFCFSQLAWMGEVMTNLLPWKDRCSAMRYLSFLPQSHVVEGILAAYAPYYMLAKADFYFLNTFDDLAQTLPKVRPTVFFSVPRFYEKVWDQLAANPLGQKYLAMRDGAGRRALGRLLRRVLLKRAGLDACHQLIVGSAPVSETLLQNFRGLGIEIHNAYGQTEAPLITINRLGDNVIPSVGTPLPETEITVLPDGELLVRGPQVALGYYGLETETIRDGVLRTGDLGFLPEDGHLLLYGRKKEMIVTSYGKNISIPKIEARLRDIPGVAEAVLIGEMRPYCTALLWLEDPAIERDGRLAARIEAMNAALSHPEQIRRYTVIDEPLRISAGELTPNLKIRRAAVEAHWRREIEEMYA